jgi:cysteine desulfurase / selenocysteine lyase
MFNVNEIRKDFPILSREVNGKPLVYLDSAATSQTPTQVIDAIVDYYTRYNANVHRGIHALSEEATAAFEETRELITDFIKADDSKEIIFTANTTAAINLVAYSWGRANIKAGDEIVLSPMEHHSNLVPWQMLAAERGAKLLFLEMTEDGQIDMESAKEWIGMRTKLVAITHMSNVLGTINPIAELAKLAHAQGALLLVDAAQSVPHMPVSVKDLDCDFLAFSLHKMLGPTGVGVLWAKRKILEAMPPFLGGGSMIGVVKRNSFTVNELPFKFEAGTPNIADVIASGAAINYLNKIGMKAVREHEIELSKYALQKFTEFAQYKNGNGTNDELILYGPRDVNKRGSVFSFTFGDIHAHDIGQILSDEGVAIRAGHHCCQPLMRELNVQSTARASFYLYNTKEEIDKLFSALGQARKVLGHVAIR